MSDLGRRRLATLVVSINLAGLGVLCLLGAPLLAHWVTR